MPKTSLKRKERPSRCSLPWWSVLLVTEDLGATSARVQHPHGMHRQRGMACSRLQELPQPPIGQRACMGLPLTAFSPSAARPALRSLEDRSNYTNRVFESPLLVPPIRFHSRSLRVQLSARYGVREPGRASSGWQVRPAAAPELLACFAEACGSVQRPAVLSLQP